MIIEHDLTTQVQCLLQFTRGETPEQQNLPDQFVYRRSQIPPFPWHALACRHRSRMIDYDPPDRLRRRPRASVFTEHSMTHQIAGAKTSAWVTAVLSAAAAVAVLFGAYLAVSQEDTEPLESPLLLSVARQLLRGPWELYGPFGRPNPYVLIHAPLYYRAAALVAWPLYGAGMDPVWAAMAAGRSLSFLGLGWTLAIAYRIARFDGLPCRVGTWAVLLIAASPVMGVMPYAVRPDMLGVALQTTGVFIVLLALRSDRPSGAYLAVAFAAFGLAACVKQHYLATAAISTFFLISAWLHGRLSIKVVASVLLTVLTIILVVYGTEELVTGGRMSQAVFRATVAASRIHPADSIRALIVFGAILGKSSGLITIMIAASLASVGARQGIARIAVVFLGTVLTILIAASGSLSLLGIVVTSRDLLLGAANLAIGVFLVVPACALLTPRSQMVAGLDRVLWIYVAAELGLVTILSWMSTGAWVNYGIQAVIFASVLIARDLERALGLIYLPRQVFPIALAAVVVFLGASGDAISIARQRSTDQNALAQVLDHLGRPPTEFFVVARPGENRVNGRLDLVYDDWLYPVFESIHQAEPRSVWLQGTLRSGGIRYIVNTSDSPKIDGLGETLPHLGYVTDFNLGPFYIWRRSTFVKVSRRYGQAAGNHTFGAD
jgi:hypothetical protein